MNDFILILLVLILEQVKAFLLGYIIGKEIKNDNK